MAEMRFEPEVEQDTGEGEEGEKEKGREEKKIERR